MSKNSRRNQKAAQSQVQQGQQPQQNQTSSQTVKPVEVGSQKGGSRTPQTRKQSSYLTQRPQAKEPELTRDQKLDCCLEKLTNLCGSQSKVLEDHEWRIHDLEKWQERQTEFVDKVTPIAAALEKDGLKTSDGLADELAQQLYDACLSYSKPMSEDAGEASSPKAAKTQPIDLSSPEDDQVDEKVPAAPEPKSGTPFKGLVPVQMYLAWNHLDESWMGPFSRMSAATQAVADLAGAGQNSYRAAMLGSTEIVWYWLDPQSGDVHRRLTAKELLKYTPR